MNPNTGCNGICYFEAYTGNIISKTIWIFLKDSKHGLAIFLIDLGSKIQGNPIFLQEHHRFSHIRLLGNLSSDFPGLLFTDPLHLCQSFRLFFHDSQGVLAEIPDDSRSQCNSHSLNRSGTKITLHCLGILRCFLRIGMDHKLPAVHMMLGKLSLCFNGYPLGNIRKGSHAGDFFLGI